MMCSKQGSRTLYRIFVAERYLRMKPIIGTAGWSIPSKDAERFPRDGTTLERYSQVFGGVEVNSSFYRSHRPSTWERWAASVPSEFRFAVKVPRTITHQANLIDTDALMTQFVSEVGELGTKLAILLVQLPPKLFFETPIAERFFMQLHETIDVAVVCEPRNPSWFTNEADATLRKLQVARVAADPALLPIAAMPGGWLGLAYWRLHGSPTIYRSPYGNKALNSYAAMIQHKLNKLSNVWCIFDNTAAFAATNNALSLAGKL
jgi:uncharacterized protein YecE (DUF72 family)